MADILLKGMEMPKIGKITLDIYPNGDAFEKCGSERIGLVKATELPHGMDDIQVEKFWEGDESLARDKHIKEMRYHQPVCEGDLHYVDVVLKDGRVQRHFKIDTIEFLEATNENLSSHL